MSYVIVFVLGFVTAATIDYFLIKSMQNKRKKSIEDMLKEAVKIEGV